MVDLSAHSPGTFCWVELTTSDGEGAKNFYTRLFGWGFNDVPVGSDSVYTMLFKEGKEVGALYEMGAEQAARDTRPAWLSFVSVESADEAADSAHAHGGAVLKAPFDVFDAGRMALLQDPTGATFAIWQPGEHIGVRVKSEHGAPCWNELATTDAAAAAAFYSDLFGWEPITREMAMGPYTSYMQDTLPVGGMLQMNEDWGECPSHWMPYFAAEDCDALASRAGELGGSVCVPPTDLPEVGRFSVIDDPQGAVFSIIQLMAR